MPIEIIKATSNDAGTIAEIHILSWQETYKGLLPQDYLDTLNIGQRKRTWEDALQKPASVTTETYLAYLDGAPVGFITFGQGRDENMKDHGELYALYIRKANRQQGIGYTLYNFAVNRLKQNGFNSSYLWVLDSNKNALDAYARWGGILDPENRKSGEIGGQKVFENMILFKHT